MMLSLRLGWPGPLPGLNNLKILSPSYGGAPRLALMGDSHSQTLAVRAVSRQVGGKLRGLLCFASVQFRHSVMSDSLRPHRLQHTRLLCPSPTPGVYSNPCPSNPCLNAMQPAHLLLSPPPPALLSQHQGLF